MAGANPGDAIPHYLLVAAEGIAAWRLTLPIFLLRNPDLARQLMYSKVDIRKPEPHFANATCPCEGRACGNQCHPS